MSQALQVELVANTSPQSISGIGRYVRELYRHLTDQIRVRLVHPISPPLAHRFTFLQHLPLGVQDHQPGSIVHFTQIMGCAQMLWNPTHPAVATVHDLGVLVCSEDELLFNAFDRRILDLQLAGLRRMDRYAVNSDSTKQDLVQQLGIPSDRIHFVQLGVDADHFRPIPDASIQVAARYRIQRIEATFDLLYVGSELPRKNMGLLLQAMAILKTQGYHLRLIKVGGAGGELWRVRFLADVARLGLQNEVVILDVVPEADLPLFYNIADVCITPTLLEGGFAWLAMEAIACERPVVATHNALVPREVQEAVILVSPSDPEELAAAVARCLDDKALRQTLGKAGRRIIARYTWEATAQAMIEVYRAAISGGHA